MDNTEAVFFDVDFWSHPLHTGSNFEGFELHDVVHGLDGDVTRPVWRCYQASVER